MQTAKLIRHFLVCALVILAMCDSVILSSVASDAEPPEDLSASGELMWTYVQSIDAVAANFTRIDQTLADACLALSQTGLQGPDAQQVLLDLSHTDPSIIDCITIDPNGIIFEVEPNEYQNIKGANISYQDHIKRLFSSKRPVVFEVIEPIEGSYALECGAPVFNEKGEFMGAASILVNSTKFFAQVLDSYQPGGKDKIWVMQTNGRILYETDTTQIGGLTFEDPLFQQYPDLLAICKRARDERSGYGTYEFLSDTHQQIVKKGVYWTTVGCHTSDFRLMLSTELE